MRASSVYFPRNAGHRDKEGGAPAVPSFALYSVVPQAGSRLILIVKGSSVAGYILYSVVPLLQTEAGGVYFPDNVPYILRRGIVQIG